MELTTTTTQTDRPIATRRIQGKLSARLRAEFERDRVERLTAAVREHQKAAEASELARRPHDLALYRSAGEVRLAPSGG